MATSLQKTILTDSDTQQSESLSHRREASRGLEIDTSTTKTNAFFHTSDLSSTPRPPPSISRKISVKQPKSTLSKQPPTPPSPTILGDANDDIYHHDSYANRLRNLVASTRQQQQQLSPIPHYLNPTSKESPTTPNFLLNEEDLIALPTPHVKETKKEHFVFPTTAQIQEIPVIHNTFFNPVHQIPILSEQPMLGDLLMKPSSTLKREKKIYQQDQDIVGKQIGQFRICQELGVGAFSKVYLANHIQTQKFFAIKTIQKGTLLDDPRVRSSIEREVGILKYIDHPNIVHLEATMETEHMMCIVLEYVEGGELFDFVQKMHHASHTAIQENMIKAIFLQLLHAVQWLHEHNIVHRDLKLENILMHKKDDETPILKITDFGLARVVDPDSPLLVTRCGSEEYAAPEIIQQQPYDGRKTDTWALGIILYSLLVGYLPFRYDPRKQERVSQLFYRIVRAQVKWPTDCNVSEEAKQVVHSILERNPQKRILIQDIEHLPWFQH
ncbi:kinase-like domain-containing protein [Gilbertella persicaria]|uniref:kinase-like domain-containing protein n=1 Tax=Gilbertella persicaria TaxID=101096 RepID=UPI00221F6184|nr:kinase-like domain-containing protein [Gilbertella persicaria]KAI8060650.1 kinase-like domain-containing protein [Gilbertella persicaria]